MILNLIEQTMYISIWSCQELSLQYKLSFDFQYRKVLIIQGDWLHINDKWT